MLTLRSPLNRAKITIGLCAAMADVLWHRERRSQPALPAISAAESRNSRAPAPVRVLGAQAFASKAWVLTAEAALKKLERTEKLTWAPSRARGPACGMCARSESYFRSSSCPVHEPRTRRILLRPAALSFCFARVPSTCFAIASALAVAPSKAAQFL